MKPVPVFPERRRSARLNNEKPKILKDLPSVKKCSVPLERFHPSISESGISAVVHLFPSPKPKSYIMEQTTTSPEAVDVKKRLVYHGGLAIGYQNLITASRKSSCSNATDNDNVEEIRTADKQKRIEVQLPLGELDSSREKRGSTISKSKATVADMKLAHQSGDISFKENMDVMEGGGDRNNNNHHNLNKVTIDGEKSLGDGVGGNAVNRKSPEGVAQSDPPKTKSEHQQPRNCSDDLKKPLEAAHLNAKIEGEKKSETEPKVDLKTVITESTKEMQVKVPKLEFLPDCNFRSTVNSESPTKDETKVSVDKPKPVLPPVDKLKLKPVVILTRLDLENFKSKFPLPNPVPEVVAAPRWEPVIYKHVQTKHKFCNICGKAVSSEGDLSSFLELNEPLTLRRFVCLTCHQRCFPTERVRHKAGCFLTHDEVYYDECEKDFAAKKKLEKFRMLACQDCVDTVKRIRIS